jgi:hypothetical protein
MLGSAISAQHRAREPATNGADHDDSGVAQLVGGAMQGRQHHLRDQQLRGQIDLDLATEHLNRDDLQRARKCGASVID